MVETGRRKRDEQVIPRREPIGKLARWPAPGVPWRRGVAVQLATPKRIVISIRLYVRALHRSPSAS